MKHRVTGRRPLALTAATTLALSGLFLGAPVAFADDSAEAPGQDAPAQVLNTKADLAEADTDMVALGQTAGGENVVVVTADTGKSDAEITQIASDNGVTDASVVKVDTALSSFAEGDIVGGQGYLSVSPDLESFVAGEPGSNAWSCSIGFAAFTPTGDPALLSAGHCAFDEDGEPLRDTTLTVPSSEDAAGGTQTALPATIDLLGTFGFAQFGGGDGGLGSNGDTTATDISTIDINEAAGWNPVPAVTDWTTAGDSLSSLADSVIEIKSVAAPTLGEVSKSGRTTGFTTGSVSSINTSVSVQYQQGCGKGKKFTVTYTGQIVITPGNFSAGGDSGSLIVTNNGSHNPVGLLFAGSSSSTIANPIGQVLQRLGSALGRTFSFGGGGGAASTTSDAIQGGGGRRPFIPGLQNLMPQLPEQAAERASAILENHRANLMFQPGVIGVGVGASGRNDGEAAFVVYVNKDAGQKPILPDSIEGIPVTVVLTDEFIAR